MSLRDALTLGALLLIGFGSAAAAGQRAGQWTVVTKIFMTGIPTEQLAMMKQMGMAGMFTGEPHTAKQCVTPEEAARGFDLDLGNSTCQFTNKVVTDTKISADMICPGPDIKGNGRMQISLAGETAFTGGWTIDGVDTDGNKVQQEIQFGGNWVKASCDPDAKK
jgi:hypothetical protein